MTIFPMKSFTASPLLCALDDGGSGRFGVVGIDGKVGMVGG